MWTVLLDPIVGINVGIEYVGDEEDNGYTVIVDLFFFRIVVIKES